jgi:hypothetical protein
MRRQHESGTPDPEVTMPTDGGSDRILQLEEEVQQLKDAVVSHAVVDQAIGMIVALGRVSPDQGWTVLKEVSQHTNIKLRSVAEMILVWGRTGVLPSEVRTVLEEALDRLGPTQIPGAPPERCAAGRRTGPAGQRGSASSSSRSWAKQLLSSRETCICEMPSCSAMVLCVMPRKNRR